MEYIFGVPDVKKNLKLRKKELLEVNSIKLLAFYL